MNRHFASAFAALVALGAAGPAPATEANKALLINISREGQYSLDGKPIEQQRLLAAIKAASGGRRFDLTISSAPQTTYEAVGKAIAAANEAGVSGLRLTTTPAPDAAASGAK